MKVNFLVGLLIVFLCLGACERVQKAGLAKEWEVYKHRFVAADGRVVDSGNQGISHSEGQGTGMLLAEAAGDRETFATLWNWTRNNLQVRGDRLFRWRRRPGTASANEDPNNASDGDILIAWALLRAGENWQAPDYRDAALAILADVRDKLIRQWHGMKILLPGAAGFENEGHLTVNLSYWIFPAFREFARADSQPSAWIELADSGRRLLELARFGPWGLPPDWLSLSEPLVPAGAFMPRFGYDAVRIPLYLAWAGADRGLLQPFADFWTAHAGYMPAWSDLRENCLDGLGAPAGMRAIKFFVMSVAGRHSEGLPGLDEQQDYYSSSLTLLSRIAAVERER